MQQKEHRYKMADKDGKRHPYAYGSMKDILEEFVDVQKRDTIELTSGHLNESKLWTQSDTSRIPWESAIKPAIRLKPPSKLKDDHLPPLDINKKYMTKAVMDFMLGPAGGVGFSERAKNTTPMTPSPEPSFIDMVKKIPSDKHLTQELELPELMLPVYEKKGKNKSKISLKHKFIISHHALPTKSEQYTRMKEFEGQIINKRDTQERNVSSGVREISRIERRLIKKLTKLEARYISRRVPSFYTLKAHSDCWDELITHSDIYGNVLRMIKAEYDRYISLLLDLQQTQNGTLFGQLDQLYEKSTKMADDVERREKQVDELEKIAMKTLNENERLRNELREKEKIVKEKQKFCIPDRSQQTHRTHAVEEKKKDLEEQVQDLHLQIGDQLKTLEEMKKDRKENYVPVIVCQRLEQCVKETELEVQKLLKQNDFLETNIDNLEEDVETLLDENGTRERDSRVLWKKINTSKIVDSNAR